MSSPDPAYTDTILDAEPTTSVIQAPLPVLPEGWCNVVYRLDTWIDTFAKFGALLSNLDPVYKESLLSEARTLTTENRIVTGRTVGLVFNPHPHLMLCRNDQRHLRKRADDAEKAILCRRVALWLRAGHAALDILITCGQVPGGWILYGDRGTLSTIPNEMFFENLQAGVYDLEL